MYCIIRIRFYPLLFALGLLLSCHINVKAQGQVFITADHFSSDKGVCRICIFSDAGSFSGKGKPFQCKEAAIQNHRAQIEFRDIPSGTYAIALFHDENNNGRMDKNFLGIPKEGYGASLNKLPFAAAPRFSENSFFVPDGQKVNLRVKLRYIL